MADLSKSANALREINDIWFDHVGLDLDQSDAVDVGFHNEDPVQELDKDSDQEDGDELPGPAVWTSLRLRQQV